MAHTVFLPTPNNATEQQEMARQQSGIVQGLAYLWISEVVHQLFNC